MSLYPRTNFFYIIYKLHLQKRYLLTYTILNIFAIINRLQDILTNQADFMSSLLKKGTRASHTII